MFIAGPKTRLFALYYRIRGNFNNDYNRITLVRGIAEFKNTGVVSRRSVVQRSEHSNHCYAGRRNFPISTLPGLECCCYLTRWYRIGRFRIFLCGTHSRFRLEKMKYAITAGLAIALQGAGAIIWSEGTFIGCSSLAISLTRWRAGKCGWTNYRACGVCPKGNTCYKVMDSAYHHINFQLPHLTFLQMSGVCVGRHEICYHEGTDIGCDDSAFLSHFPLLPPLVSTLPTTESRITDFTSTSQPRWS